ncbi:MAG: hypothetical protein MJY87_02350 [Fibrobacter sp.]|nr:hypothetical protein [Fibrobacter sp.]
MSLKVLSMQVPASFPLEGPDKSCLYHAKAHFGFTAICEIDGVVGKLVFTHLKGCPYNGASNPIQWPIKNYYGETKKDACGLGHDALYAWGGLVNGLSRKLTAGECDDFLRGSMREAGFTRVEAGIVDRAVRWFAHIFHFGPKNDKEKMHEYCQITWRPM